jgi:serine/threonine protein phosphatase 1
MFNRSRSKSRPAIPFGHRVYAIGDIHGEAGLLRRVLRLIEEDNTARREAVVTLIFLGDLIDRGPDAAAVLETFARMRIDNVVVLKGNHEEALVQAYHGDDNVLDQWLPFGAMATLTGFGVTLKEIDSSNTVFADALRTRIDRDLIDWLENLPSAWECGGYYFTHAGVRPGVDLANQRESDLRWIREPFLSSRRDHGKVIVHGHTVEPGVPSLGGNRIGIDTGAHEHGVLTALGLEGERQWLLQATGKTDGDDADRPPVQDIAVLITSIVTPPPPPARDALLLPTPQADASDSPTGHTKKLGNKGVVVAGFALTLAVLGGVIAVRSDLWPRGPGDVSLSIPESLDGQNVAAPAPAPSPVASTRPGKQIGERRRVRRPAVQPLADPALSNSGDEASPRLYGDSLDKALEEDRDTTRKLNIDELSRQRTPRDAR